MKNGNLLIALIIGGVIGFVIGKTTTTTTSAPSAPTIAQKDDGKPAPARPAAAGDDKNVYKIPVGNAPVKGPATAKITIVEYSDFQCPFCSRVNPTIKQIQETYGSNVRIAFKQNPLPFHADAPLAAEAALAANEQGKFWEMHDKLFGNQSGLKRDDLEKYAQELGLDMGKFKAALDSHKFKDQIEKDKAEAANFQANGTPHFFVNGVRVKGARPFADFKTVIDEQLAKADKLASSGVKPADIYEAATKDGLTKGAAPAPAPNPGQQAPSVRKILEKDLAGSPVLGASKAKVTIVEWSDFQCPFCSRAAPTIEKIVKDYPKDVRLIFKHQPLPFHPNAAPAAIASMAAHNQGKFWEFHDKAFAGAKELSPEKYEAWAKELGLNMSKFKADMADPKTKEKVDADSRQGTSFGANGTPTFFINGIEMAGALPYEQFKAAVDEQIKKADEQLKNGVKQEELYEKMLAVNAAAAPKAPAPTAAAPADDGKPVKIDIGGAPVRGDPKAKVTIIEFSDFQCPFCSRASKTVDAVLEKYKGKVKVAFKHQPLPFHPNAKPAAKAAMAANEQGKFWEFHDKAFANQQQLTPENYEAWAKEIGLNMSKFKEAMASSKLDAVIEADSQLGTSVGAGGTPTFFINGRKLVGAQPQEQFEAIIEEELKK